MPLFSPETTIRFLSNTGIDDSNKPNFTSNAAMTSWLIGKTKYTKTGLSYQRADEIQFTSVDLNYYDLLSCDAMMWQNAGTSDQWLVANITDLEWVNPNLTRVYFKVDAYCSFCGNITWTDSYCFVEREHVLNDWSGSNPNFDNMGVPESFDISPDSILSYTDVTFTPDTYIIISPYDENGEPNIKGDRSYGIYDGLNEIITTSIEVVASYLNTLATADESKLQNVVGIISVPSQFLNTGFAETTEIAAPWTTLNTINNAKCFSSQFCNVSIESTLSSSVVYKPELMEVGPTWQFSYMGYRVGMSCGFRATPQNYSGVRQVEIPDLGMLVNAVPQGAFIGNAFAQYMSTNAISMAIRAMSAIGSAAGVVGGLATGGLSTAAMGLLGTAAGQTGGSLFQEWREARKNSAVIGGNANSSDTNLAVAAGGYGFYIRVYVPIQSKLNALDNFFDRYGYKVNRLKTPNINTRPCWNYVKTSEAHISGSIPYIYKQQLESLLNNGCTFWNVAARDIGDYSNPEENKG